MKIISKDNLVYTMDKENKPVERVKSRESVIFETCDCFSDSIADEETLVTNIDFSYINPATGPVYIEDAKKGDILKVTIESIEVKDQGVIIVAPGFGLIGDLVEVPSTRILPIKDDKIYYLGKEQKLNKMIGVIGTAPSGESMPTGTPGDHGGNMDSLAIKEGAILYLPIEVEGALFALGDLHASMGDGEVGAAGVEIAGQVQVRLEVIKDENIPTPFVESENAYIAIASAKEWSDAGKKATENMANYIKDTSSLSFNDALMLLSGWGNLKVNQVVNPNVSFRMEVEKSVIEKYR